MKFGIGVDGPIGEFKIPLYTNNGEERSLLTIDPIAIRLGRYSFEPSVSLTPGDIMTVARGVGSLIENIYRRLRP